MITPTIGRVVWYHPTLIDGMRLSKDPHAATVAYVWNERTVNLSVVDHSGYQYTKQSVPLLQGEGPHPASGGFCTWMPYQIGQAKAAT